MQANSKKDAVVLVNPPNDKIVLRDLYSSTISKGVYNWPCVDLLVLSGILKNYYNVHLIDANTLRLSVEETVKRIVALQPKGIVFSFGVSVKEQDYAFVAELRRMLPDAKICGTGGLLYHNAEFELEHHHEFDACLLNFTTDDILEYLSNDYDHLFNIVYRENGKIVQKPIKYPDSGFSFPVPLHNQLPLNRYRMSHGKASPLTAVLTAYGCPARCGFCVSGRIDYRTRDVENVIEELDYIKRLGVREIFFRDNAFGARKKESFQLMNRMIEKDYRFSWVADTMVNVLTEESASLMKRAGCHALHMGVESSSIETLRKYNKRIDIGTIKRAFGLCKDKGIKSVGYFIIGLPGETIDDVKRTIDLAIELDCDYASFNIALPIIGTNLHDEVIEKNLINANDNYEYDGSLTPTIETDKLSKEDVTKMRKLAMKRFYLRPSFVARKVGGIRTMFELKMLILEFIHLIKPT